MDLLYPVPESSLISQTFQEHVDYAKLKNLKYYNGGIDWYVLTGTPVKAAAPGKVIMIRRDETGYGYHVRIQHAGGFITIYAHLLDCKVIVGQQVAAGEVIGRSDNTGNSTGPHLHFELRKDGIPVDPAPYLVKSTAQVVSNPAASTAAPPAVKPALPAFPALPKARIMSAIGLNVRDEPRGSFITYLRYNTVLSVISGVETPAGEIWLQIGPDMWIAMWTPDDGLLAEWV